MTSQRALMGATIRPWRIEPIDRSSLAIPQDQRLSFGKNQIALRDISHCRVHKEIDWDIAGQHFNFMLYVGMAAMFLFLIVDAGWRIQFLIAVVLFFAIAAMSLADVMTTKKINFYRVEFRTTNGCDHSYTTASRQDADALLSAMHNAGVRVM